MSVNRASPRRLLETILQSLHVANWRSVTLGFAQPDPVDDRGVVEAVGDNRVLFIQERLEHAAVGVEAGGEEDGVLLAEVPGDRRFELAVQRLRAADEAHRGHAEAEFVHRPPRGGDDVRMIGQAEIIVGAEIDRLARAFRRGDADPSTLRAGQQPLALGEAGRLDFVEGRADVTQESIGHGGLAGCGRTFGLMAAPR